MKPCVRDPELIGSNFVSVVRPGRIDSVVIGRDVASYLNRELFDGVRLKLDAFNFNFSNYKSQIAWPRRGL